LLATASLARADSEKPNPVLTKALPGKKLQSDPNGKQTRKPPLPPLIRPTAPSQAPLTARQTASHAARMREAQTASPGAFHAGPEPMASPQEIRERTETEARRGALFAEIVRGNPKLKEIALTFDDGPHPLFTPRLLDLLKELHVHATFFLVGKKVDAAPYLVARMVQEGHDVGNHTYHHVNLTRIPEDLVEDEIRLNNDTIRNACGLQPLFFRPPGGQYDEATIRAAEKLKMITTLWTDDPGDYARPGAELIETRLLLHARNGAVILLHDGIEQTFAILPDFVARMRREGFRFVTMTEMAQHMESSPLVRP
jgi:peptidoglycan/xylan/chitin deacetylase (PgdA/CDA1 family)